VIGSEQLRARLALWCSANHLTDYEEALWIAVSGLRDRDTICATVGGIVSGYTGTERIPSSWRDKREALPALDSELPCNVP